MLRYSHSLALLAMVTALAGVAQAQTIQINRENKTIAISTTDEATATADIAAITIGFKIFGPDAQSLNVDGGKLSHAIIEALHKAGIDDKAIESDTQDIMHNVDYNEKETEEQRANRQFVLRQSWEVSVASQYAAEVIRVAVAAGANESGAIDWRLDNRKALQAKAAGNALIKAREVASRMADGLHVKLGDLIYASNETPNQKFHISAYDKMTVTATVAPEPGPPLEIRPQTIHEEATVYAVFSIE